MSYPDNAPASRDLHERAKGYPSGGNTRRTVYMRPFPIYAARGDALLRSGGPAVGGAIRAAVMTGRRRRTWKEPVTCAS
jgi:hypothetical protein